LPDSLDAEPSVIPLFTIRLKALANRGAVKIGFAVREL
jgi:hypothetical protein